MSKGVVALRVLMLACVAGGGAVLAQPPAPLGSELLVNSYTASNQTAPAIASNAAGNFVVWSSNLQDGSLSGIFTRRFHANGTVDIAELQVNTITVSSQQYPSVASDSDGDFIVTWTSGHTAAPKDIFAQRFGVQPLIDVDGNGVFEPPADGLLILRFGFGFTGTTLINGAVGDGCTRCDAPSITAFMQNFL